MKVSTSQVTDYIIGLRVKFDHIIGCIYKSKEQIISLLQKKFIAKNLHHEKKNISNFNKSNTLTIG